MEIRHQNVFRVLFPITGFAHGLVVGLEHELGLVMLGQACPEMRQRGGVETRDVRAKRVAPARVEAAGVGAGAIREALHELQDGHGHELHGVGLGASEVRRVHNLEFEPVRLQRREQMLAQEPEGLEFGGFGVEVDGDAMHGSTLYRQTIKKANRLFQRNQMLKADPDTPSPCRYLNPSKFF